MVQYNFSPSLSMSARIVLLCFSLQAIATIVEVGNLLKLRFSRQPNSITAPHWWTDYPVNLYLRNLKNLKTIKDASNNLPSAHRSVPPNFTWRHVTWRHDFSLSDSCPSFCHVSHAVIWLLVVVFSLHLKGQLLTKCFKIAFVIFLLWVTLHTNVFCQITLESLLF